MRGIELLGILVGLYLIYKSASLLRNKEEDVLNFAIWLIVGSGLIIGGVFPQLFTYVRRFLGMERRAYTIFGIGILLSYLLIFRIFSYLRELKTDISKINEEISLIEGSDED